MRLPASLWKLLRSRRTKLALAWSPFVFAALVAASYATVNGYGANALRKLAADLVGRGYPRTMAEACGPALPDSENLLMQPAVLEAWEKAIAENGKPPEGTPPKIAKTLKKAAADRKAAEQAELEKHHRLLDAEWTMLNKALTDHQAKTPKLPPE